MAGWIHPDGRVDREGYNKKKLYFPLLTGEDECFLLNQVEFQKIVRFEWASKDLTQEVFLQEERHPQCIPEEHKQLDIHISIYKEIDIDIDTDIEIDR